MKLFYQILINSLVASITNFTIWFALTFYVYLETRSIMATSIIAGLYLILTAVSGFWFGGLVDRHKKKNILILSTVASLFSFIFSFAVYVTASENTFNNPGNPLLWILVTLIMLGVIAGNIRAIALPTIVTMLFPEDNRDKANGLTGTVNGIGFLVTSMISGFLVAHSGLYLALILATVITISVIIHLFYIKIPEKKVVHTEEYDTKKLDIKGTLKVIAAVPGLFALIFFTTFNNFLGGVFMSLMDAYGLSLVKVQTWGVIWGLLSLGFILGGLAIAKFGLGKSPLRSLFVANLVIWTISTFFTIQPWLWLLIAGMFIYLCVVPYIEASEQTILQKVVPYQRQGRVFGFAHSVEQAASPLTAFVIGPITQFIFIPFMTNGAGTKLIGGWFGTGTNRGIALVFTLTGIIGLLATFLAMNSTYSKKLAKSYRGE